MVFFSVLLNYSYFSLHHLNVNFSTIFLFNNLIAFNNILKIPYGYDIPIHPYSQGLYLFLSLDHLAHSAAALSIFADMLSVCS